MFSLRRSGQPEPANFHITRRDRVVEIRSEHAELTIGRAQPLAALLRGLLSAQPAVILVNLESGQTVDTTMLAVLIDAHARARRGSTELIVRGSPALRELAGICRLEGVLPLA